MAATRTLAPPQGWRCLVIEGAALARPNYLYTLPIQQLSAAASVVRTELKQVVQGLVQSGTWQGVRLTPREDTAT